MNFIRLVSTMYLTRCQNINIIMLKCIITLIISCEIIFTLNVKPPGNYTNFHIKNISQTTTDHETDLPIGANSSIVDSNFDIKNNISQITSGNKTDPFIGANSSIVASAIGEYCITSSQCNIISNSVCFNSTCQCTANHTFVPDLKSCRKESRVGDRCKESLECQISVSRSFCRNGLCSCSNHWPIYFAERSSCIKKVKIGDSCEVDSQCTSLTTQSQCILGNCSCLPHFPVIINGQCYSKTKLGDYCVSSKQCNFMVPNSHCKRSSETPVGICDCNAGFSPHWYKCIRDEVSTTPLATTQAADKNTSLYLKIIVGSSVMATVFLLIFIIIFFIKKKEIRSLDKLGLIPPGGVNKSISKSRFQSFLHAKNLRGNHHNRSEIPTSINCTPAETESYEWNRNNFGSFDDDNMPPIYDSIIHEISFPVKKPGPAVLAHNFLVSLEDDNPDSRQMQLCPTNI